MKNPDLNEILGEGPSKADEKMQRMMPGRPEKMKDVSFDSAIIHTKGEMQNELKNYSEYVDVSKKDDGKEAIKVAKKANPQGLEGGRSVNVEYNNYRYKVVVFNVGTADKYKEEWFAFKGDQIEEESEIAPTLSESAYQGEVAKAFKNKPYEKIEKPSGQARKALEHAEENIGDDQNVYEVTQGGKVVYVYTRDGSLYKLK